MKVLAKHHNCIISVIMPKAKLKKTVLSETSFVFPGVTVPIVNVAGIIVRYILKAEIWNMALLLKQALLSVVLVLLKCF